MRTIAIGSVLFAAVVGCDGQSKKAPTSVSGQPVQPAQAGTASAANAGANRIESRLGASEIPKSPEVFKDEFVRRFNEDNYGAFRDLCYWEGVPDDARQLNMTVFMIGMKNSTVTEARIEPCAPDQYETHFYQPDFQGVPNLTPTHTLYLETKGKAEPGDGADGEDEVDSGPTTAGNYPVGVKDGGYYLCVGVLPK